MITVNQQKLKKAIIDYLNSDGEKDPGLVSMGKLLLKTIEEKETYDLIRNATLKRQCYNCALKKDCERDHPDTYEPIGTCDKWENLVAKWKPTDEDIKSCIGMCLTDANEQRFKDYNTSLKDCLDWFEKKTEQKSINLHDKIEELCSKYPINKYSMNDEELSSYHQGVHLGARKIAEYLSEQKLIEWSEEDEDMRDTIIRDLKFLGGDMVNISPAYKEEVDWLKSLRPSWKPSEEQMKALLNAEGFLRAGLQHDSAKTIAELYEQLKKL